MKKSKLFTTIGALGIASLSLVLIAADHNDAPAVAGTTADITDFYAFEGANSSNFVLAANVQGLLVPGSPTVQASFDEAILIEFNIDYNNDLKEDLVIQAIKRNDSMYFFGPSAPAYSGQDGTKSTIATGTPNRVKISSATDVQIAENNGMKFFAGPREDPFFFDFNQYNAIVSGTATSFENPGVDTYAATNVLSVVVEFPKSMLPNAATGVNPFSPSTPIYNVWVETKRKQ